MNDRIENYIAGAGTGYATYNFVKNNFRITFGNPCRNMIKRLIKTEDNIIYKKAAIKAFKKSELESKGYKINNVTSKNIETLINEEKKCIRNHLENKFQKVSKVFGEKVGSFFVNKYTKKINPSITASYKETLHGKNAFLNPLTKCININAEKSPQFIFHEMGHAINRSNSITRYIANSKKTVRLIPFILAVALLKNKKQENEKPQGIIDKTTTFIKDNCGKLATLTFVPLLLDEANASINAAKMAKPLLEPKLYKNLNKINAYAYGTHFTAAMGICLGIYCASKVKDKFTEHK